MKKVTVLIIDDDSSFCEIMAEMLVLRFKDSIEIVCAKNKEEYQELKHENFDICVVDNFINGTPVAKEIIEDIKECKPLVLIYVATGYASYEVLKSLINSGINGFLEKNELNFNLIISKIEEIQNAEAKLEEIKRKINNI